MTWDELATMQRFVAKHLLDERNEQLYRACCTRAYYAAYAAITARIAEDISFAHGWRNPAHAALPGHVNQMAGLSASTKESSS